jgi:hypothetical protein
VNVTGISDTDFSQYKMKMSGEIVSFDGRQEEQNELDQARGPPIDDDDDDENDDDYSVDRDQLEEYDQMLEQLGNFPVCT